MHQVSIDVGDDSFKIICNTFSKHQDPEILFTRTDEPGNLCSGINRSIILAFAEVVQENHHNLRVICELLEFHNLDCVVAADLKLLNVLLGLSSHSGKYACYICEGEVGLEAGPLHTFSSLIQINQAYIAAGSKPATMQKYKNCVNPPLLHMPEDQLVQEAVPPPELHLMMGAVNKKLELIREFVAKQVLEDQLWEWCSKHGMTRRGV